MRIRIPRWVDRAWDAASARTPYLAAVAVVSAVVVISLRWRGAPAIAAAVVTGASLLLAIHLRVKARLVERIAQLKYENAAQTGELEQMRAGNPTAETVAIEPIGAHGEWT